LNGDYHTPKWTAGVEKGKGRNGRFSTWHGFVVPNGFARYIYAAGGVA